MKELFDDGEAFLIENDPEYYYDQDKEDIYDILEHSEIVHQNDYDALIYGQLIVDPDENLSYEDFAEQYQYQQE